MNEVMREDEDRKFMARKDVQRRKCSGFYEVVTTCDGKICFREARRRRKW